MDDPLGLLGTTIAEKYRVERLLGQGGFGVVYAGMQLILRQPVAIKLIKPGAPGSTAFTVATFLREAKVLFGLTHPGIVRMYDVGETKTALGPAPYVVLELIEGTTLAEEIARRRRGQSPPFASHELRAIFEPVIDALAFAHARGVVHRDLKPANIMVVGSSPTLTAKVLDFGLADGAPDIATATVAGLTPLYAAPEQWNPHTFGTVGPATDVFALGLCMEEAITLAPAVDGDSIPAIVASATNPSRASRIATTRPDLPRPLEQVVVRATRVRPPDRFASAGELLTAFKGALSPSMMPPSMPAQSAAPMTNAPHSPYAATFATTSAVQAAPPPPPPPPKSNAALFVALIVGGFLFLGLLVTAAAALLLLRHDDEDPKPVAQVIDAGTQPFPPPVVTTAMTATTATTPPKPSPAPSPTVTVFSVSTGDHAGIEPDLAKFKSVVAQNGPGLEQCFRQAQAASPEWSAVMNVTFTKDGGRGGKAFIRKSGVDQASGQAEQIKDCIYGSVPRWPWPKPPIFDSPDGGGARLAIHMRWDRK